MNNTRLSICDQLSCVDKDAEIDRLLLSLKDPQPDPDPASVEWLLQRIDAINAEMSAPGSEPDVQIKKATAKIDTIVFKHDRIDHPVALQRRLAKHAGAGSVSVYDQEIRIQDPEPSILRALSFDGCYPDPIRVDIALDLFPVENCERERTRAVAMMMENYKRPALVLGDRWRRYKQTGTFYAGAFDRTARTPSEVVVCCYDKIFDRGAPLPDATKHSARFELRLSRGGIRASRSNFSADNLMSGFFGFRNFRDFFRFQNGLDKRAGDALDRLSKRWSLMLETDSKHCAL